MSFPSEVPMWIRVWESVEEMEREDREEERGGGVSEGWNSAEGSRTVRCLNWGFAIGGR